MKTHRAVMSIVLLAACAAGANADDVIPHTFVGGKTIRAHEMNENFRGLRHQIEALQAQVAALQDQVATLQANSVLALDGVVSVGDDANGYRTVLFSGVNVQIVNGLDSTGTTNGVGNLIVGYNERRGAFDVECSFGAVPVTDCVAEGYILASDHKSGSHNVIVGGRHNYSWYGGLVTGLTNSILAPGTAVIGGDVNHADNFGSVVIGGGDNHARAVKSVVSGGRFNTTTRDANFGSVLGGNHNSVIDEDASVTGGSFNKASGSSASVTGGSHNTASGVGATVSGGRGCLEARDWGWSVANTAGNTTSSTADCVPGLSNP